jgi:hypothetical protein
LNAGLAERVDAHMRTHYRVPLAAMEMTDTPGYWRDKEPRMHPGHPLHSCLGCDGPFSATYTYFDPPRIGGRFASRTRTWAALRANASLTGEPGSSGAAEFKR